MPKIFRDDFLTRMGPSVPKIFRDDFFTRMGPSVTKIFRDDFLIIIIIIIVHNLYSAALLKDPAALYNNDNVNIKSVR